MATSEVEHRERLAVPRVGSAVLVVAGDRLLLGVRDKEPHRGRWVLPGGRVKPFETIQEAAQRELREETGLEIELDETLEVVEVINPPDEHRVIVYSRGRAIGGQVRASSDLKEAGFFRREEIQRLDLTPAVSGILRRQGWI